MPKQDIPRIYSLPGRAVAFQQVSIRPRVCGFIQEILFDPKVAFQVALSHGFGNNEVSGVVFRHQIERSRKI